MLHVPSPDWRDQVIYFLMTDRFDDGEPGNNDQGAGEFAAGEAEKYNGGDLRGIERRIDYIKGLGATAIWITPPVANQWRAPHSDITGYHGYWAEHFKKVDPHLGTLADYQRLSSRIHCAGLYLVQDIVVNHTGDYFSYGPNWKPGRPESGYIAHDRTAPVPRPSQPPFDLNDPRRAADRQAAVYHWTPNVSNYADSRQEMTFQMSGLDDLNTDNPRVRAALRDSYAYWIREAGVDAFRVDTAFYVAPGFFKDFLHSADARNPGIDRVARATGRDAFLVFGEGFGIDGPGQTRQARKIEGYMNDRAGSPRMPGMLNFPLYGAIQNVIARGKPTSELGHRIEAMMKIHRRAHLMPTFVDNHDVDRFLAGASSTALKQALLAIMTLPGIPTIYYGTEQAFNVPRAAMFKAGYQSGGYDRFDADAPLYTYIRTLTALRREHRVLSRGSPRILKSNDAGAGALVYDMKLGHERLVIALNTADTETLAANIETGLPAG
ncbi:MAG TPA: alpha-amylase family glycosyl hydrolase, partial [Usitatibacteraceae bacterium]|nr:alpha-amylase family glycosyl hydrolase [Usitatibacteraceae bacterium]